MKQIRIGGVPEHFNLPWHLTLENNEYANEGINLIWKDFYGGTGEMCKALREESIDIAIILTEGIIKDIISGNPSKIIQTYVESPLIWGVHVAHHSKYNSIIDIRGTKAAISRYGSGSHLMAYINAKNNNWDLEKDLKFEVIEDLKGAVKGLTKNEADYFLWEKYTTKPLVDNSTFRRIDECPSPWPCFVIAARNKIIKKNTKELKAILNIINTTTKEFKYIPSINKTIANRYEQKLDDINEWLSITEWSQELISEDLMATIQDQLKAVNIINKTMNYSDIVEALY